MTATMKNLETQMGQLASELKNQQKGKFPSDTEQNPRDHCKAITLRNGKEVESSRQKEERKEEEKSGKGLENEQNRTTETAPTRCNEIPIHCNKSSKSRGILFLNNPSIITPPLLFP